MSIFPIGFYKVTGRSMEPSFLEGDYLVLQKWFYKPKKEDIVVFQSNHQLLIKRIKKVKKDQYYVRGDNAKQSTDSRAFGWIPLKAVAGKVCFRIKNQA